MPKLLDYNAQPISLRNGAIFLDGLKVFDAVKGEIKFTPDVWSGRQLGDKAKSSRWLGYAITVSVTRRRSTPWTKEVIKKYIASGKTPEFTVQDVLDDPGSDYGAAYGSDTTTAVGCVLTGDMTLAQLDAEGEIFDETLAFNAYDVV